MASYYSNDPRAFQEFGNGDPSAPSPEHNEQIYDTVQNRADSEPLVEPWKNIKKRHPKMQLTTKTSRRESLCFIFTLKFFRLLCFFFSFVIILGCSVMSKMTLTLMAAQTLPNRTMDIHVPYPNKRFTVETTPLERMSWIWSLWFVIIIPEILVFLNSLWVCVFKKASKPWVKSFFLILLGETFHVVGLCVLVFEVMSGMDSVRVVMFLNGLCLVPGILTLFSRNNTQDFFHLKVAIDIACLVGIMGGIILWAQGERKWVLILVGVLVSCNWWENFVRKESGVEFIKSLAKIKKNLQSDNRRSFAYLFVSLWKILISFVAFVVYLVIHSTAKEDLVDYLSSFSKSFQNQPVPLVQAWQTASQLYRGDLGETMSSSGLLPLYLLLFQAGMSFVCYSASLFACRIGIQEFSFSLALLISTPISVFLSSSACSWRMEDPSFLTDLFPRYVYWNCPDHEFFETFLTVKYGWVWVIWFFSQLWFTAYIWSPTRNNEELFVLPLYTGAIVEQSLVSNRVNQPKKVSQTIIRDIQPEIVNQYYDSEYDCIRSNTLIYGCATMWHEDKDEMRDMMKSVMRMDRELQKHRLARDFTNQTIEEKAKYDFEFQTHIFLDDAFEFRKLENGKKIRVVNKYVKQLVKAKLDAEKIMYGKDLVVIGQMPAIYVTPYGGRMTWTLPGNSKVYVHLKDKLKIKIKKRWSQVMYMFYLLGYLMLDKQIDREEPEENTFILALDGDVDFKPEAIQRLLDLMQRDSSLGAACGRIHPIGQGPIAWYQRFEYAIGHWLQKATEHVTGCVLCSPGCFSLFRAGPLLQVVETYSQVASKPIERVQFDLGEDRWLCTLLLKRGYRIEYSAASDAYTRCPESFKIFYNQRRRWGPSTMANILDILTGWKETVQKNTSISTLYILYTGLIMIGTVLGPGTIFLMITGAISAAFKVSNSIAIVVNLVPIALFVLVCFFTKEDIQILLAMILSTLYALLMMAVLIGTTIQLKDDGITSPSGLFLIALAASFVIAAIIHPQEFYCLKHGILYFLLVPSMYLLLMLYSLINMNNISWGTRENATPEGPKAAEPDKAEDKKGTGAEKKNNGYFSNFSKFFDMKKDQSAFSKFCSCFLCTYEKEDEATQQLLQRVGVLVEENNAKLSHMERTTVGFRNLPSPMGQKQFLPPSLGVNSTLDTVPEADYQNKDEIEETNQQASDEQNKEAPAESENDEQRWTRSKTFQGCEVIYLNYHEEKFWTEVIEDYLKPDKKLTDAEKDAGDKELKEMRNNYVFAFFMLNGLFILVVFLLQMNKEELYITWPIDAKYDLTYIPVSNVVQLEKEYLHLEPFGFVFALFFGVILVLQFLAMLVHRFGTFTQLMEDTTLNCKVKVSDELDFDDEDEEVIEEDSDEEVGKPKDKSKSVAGNILARDPARRKGSVVAYLVNEEEKAPAKNLEEAMLKKIQEKGDEAENAAKSNAPVLRKSRKKYEKYRRMSRDPRFLGRINRGDGDTDSIISRSDSINVSRQNSVVSQTTHVNRRYIGNRTSQKARNRNSNLSTVSSEVDITELPERPGSSSGHQGQEHVVIHHDNRADTPA